MSDPDQISAPESVLSEQLRFKLEQLPKKAGVYQFLNVEGSVIYVGKAKNLRNRVRSYFQERGVHDPKRDVLVAKISDIETVVTDSEVEALLLENNLIKQHAPRYNIRLKDDKSYPYIVITNEPYPRVFPTRTVRRDGSRYFGPYADVRAMHLMIRMLRAIFPIRSCDYHLDDDNVAQRRYKLCLDYHIHKCKGPCEGLISRDEYLATIRQVEALLKGKTRGLQSVIEEEMHALSARLEFEKAADARNRLHALQKYQDRQKIVATDFADRDILAVATAASDAVGVVFRVRDGKIIGKQHLTFTGADVESNADIAEHFVQRYYGTTQDIPPEVLVSDELDNADMVEQWLREMAGCAVTIAVPKIGEKAKLMNMCRANARYVLDEILIQRYKTDDFIPKSVQALQRDLHLSHPPRRIECFDISHHQGSETVASMVAFLDGKARKSEYRKFKIESVQGVDDFASMREVVSRRYSRLLEEQGTMPDLVVVDGGKGQLSSAVEILNNLGLSNQPIIGLAKRLEEVFVPGESLPVNIAKTSPGLRLLQRVRDEAHRFAIEFHRARRTKATLQTELEDIDGVGPKRAAQLLEMLGSVRSVQSATAEQIAAVIGWSAAKRVHAHFHPEEESESDAGIMILDEDAGTDAMDNGDDVAAS
jgi:excinuclease ABC subunit C